MSVWQGLALGRESCALASLGPDPEQVQCVVYRCGDESLSRLCSSEVRVPNLETLRGDCNILTKKFAAAEFSNRLEDPLRNTGGDIDGLAIVVPYHTSPIARECVVTALSNTLHNAVKKGWIHLSNQGQGRPAENLVTCVESPFALWAGLDGKPFGRGASVGMIVPGLRKSVEVSILGFNGALRMLWTGEADEMTLGAVFESARATVVSIPTRWVVTSESIAARLRNVLSGIPLEVDVIREWEQHAAKGSARLLADRTGDQRVALSRIAPRTVGIFCQDTENDAEFFWRSLWNRGATDTDLRLPVTLQVEGIEGAGLDIVCAAILDDTVSNDWIHWSQTERDRPKMIWWNDAPRRPMPLNSRGELTFTPILDEFGARLT